MSSNPEDKLLDLNIKLTNPPTPAANYSPFVIQDNFVFISGQLPFINGVLEVTGRVGENVSVEQAAIQAKHCAINLLSQLKIACKGDLNRVVKVIKLGGFVCCTDNFTQQPEVINGASNFIVDIFGEEIGQHSRFAVGTNSLPKGTCVEIEGIFKIKD